VRGGEDNKAEKRKPQAFVRGVAVLAKNMWGSSLMILYGYIVWCLGAGVLCRL